MPAAASAAAASFSGNPASQFWLEPEGLRLTPHFVTQGAGCLSYPVGAYNIRAQAASRRYILCGLPDRDLQAWTERSAGMQIRKWLSRFCFFVAPLLGLFGILLGSSLETGVWQSLPYSSHIVGTVFLLLFGASLLVLYAVFVTMIVTWDIDRISYAVEEEAQRRFLKRISPEKPKARGPKRLSRRSG